MLATTPPRQQASPPTIGSMEALNEMHNSNPFLHGEYVTHQWFRMYAEFLSDPKVQMMSEALQRRLIMLFCARCNGDETLQDEEVTFLLRIDAQEWLATKAEFIKRGFIDSHNKLINWDKRQYRSDSSSERVRKHREAKKHIDVTTCNVSVTPQNRTEQNRTDTEGVIKEITPKRVRTKNAKPEISLADLTADAIADWLAKKRGEGRYLQHDEHFILEYFKNYCISKGKKYNDYTAAYRNAFEWESCQPNKQNKGKSSGFHHPTKDDRAKAAVMRAAERLGFA